MKNRFAFAIVLLFMSVLLVPKIKPVWSNYTLAGTIYIRADGSVEPDTAPISCVDGITYVFTDNIVASVYNDDYALIVEKDNIIIDGAGYDLRPTGEWSSTGIYLLRRNNVKITNLNIKNFGHGIVVSLSSNNQIVENDLENRLTDIEISDSSNHNNVSDNIFTGSPQVSISIADSSFNIISANDITQEGVGICVYGTNNNISGNFISTRFNGINIYSSYNEISYNNIVACSDYGIWLIAAQNNYIYSNNLTNNGVGIQIKNSPYTTPSTSENNIIYHNNFLYNEVQVYLTSDNPNSWDDGYPSGGNYYSDYNGQDSNGDGIGDTAYVFNENNQDKYPLVTQYIIPEFPSFLFLPLFITLTLLSLMIYRRK